MSSMDDNRGLEPPSSPLSEIDDFNLPSSPLSYISCSSRVPSPEYDNRYPSPSSSDNSRSSSKCREDMIFPDENPFKKRKIHHPKERTTEYLGLHNYEGFDEGDDNNLQRLLYALRKKRKIVVIAGAGISVSAGIPDFRSDTGLFKSLRTTHNLKSSGKALFDAAVYKDDDATATFHDMVRELSHATRAAEPTKFHHMLASLADDGRLLRLYTQNVDGIDTRLKPLATTIPLPEKGPWPQTVQLHGGLDKMVCSKCQELKDFDADLFEGSETPPCKSCEGMDEARAVVGKRSHGVGRLRPRMVLYNEYNPDQDAIGAVSTSDLKSRPDAVIVVGTSLKVPGVRRIAAEMCKVARGRKDGFTAWIGHDSEPSGNEFQDCWDLVVKGDSDEVARLLNLPRWDDKDIGQFKDVTGLKLETRPIKVEFESKVKTQLVTPSASPRKGTPIPMRDGAAEKKKVQSKLSIGTTKRVPLPANAPETKVVVPAKRKASVTPVPILPPTKKTGAPKKKVLATAARSKSAPEKPRNKITNTFTATKRTKTAVGKDGAKKEDIKPATNSIFPKLSKAGRATNNSRQSPSPVVKVLQPTRPREMRNNSSSLTPTSAVCTNRSKPFEIMDSPASVRSTEDVDESPGMQLRRESRSGVERMTISPKGTLPTGMARLIDVE